MNTNFYTPRYRSGMSMGMILVIIVAVAALVAGVYYYVWPMMSGAGASHGVSHEIISNRLPKMPLPSQPQPAVSGQQVLDVTMPSSFTDTLHSHEPNAPTMATHDDPYGSSILSNPLPQSYEDPDIVHRVRKQGWVVDLTHGVDSEAKTKFDCASICAGHVQLIDAKVYEQCNCYGAM